MKKTLAGLLFLLASAGYGQIIDFAYHLTASSYPLNGGPASAGSSVGPYSGTPVLGDIIYFNGTNWVSLGIGSATNVLTVTGGVPVWAAASGGGLADPGGNGMLARTALNTTINRTIVCAAAYCTWANGDGVAGAPSLTLSITPANPGGAVALQASTPGTAQTGNYNIEGVGIHSKTNIITTQTDAMLLSNLQAATNGTRVQYSPALRFDGTAWDQDDAITRTNSWRIYNQPVSGATLNTSSLFFDWSIDGTTFNNFLQISSTGSITSTNGGVNIASGRQYCTVSRGCMAATATDGQIRFTNNAQTTGTGIVSTGQEDIETVNGAKVQYGSSSEQLTIAAAATTDTAANLLPANSWIVGVVVRVTTVIPTATTFQVGDATTAGRFCGTGLTFGPVAVAANTTGVCNSHLDPANANAAGPNQVAAAKVRITPSSTPGTGTGVVRITVFWKTFVPPTS